MEQELEKISGTVEDVTYHNEESGFTVLLVDVDGDPVTVVGEVPEIAEGEEITATGSYKVHGTYGVPCPQRPGPSASTYPPGR